IELHGGDEVLGTDFTLVPVRTFNVKGRVYDAVEARPGVHASVWLMPRDTKDESWSNASFNPADAPQGAFEVHGRKPGDYYSAGEDVLESGLQVTREEPPGPLEAVISPGGGRIEGLVSKEDKSFTGATVVLVPGADLRKQSRLYKSSTTDQKGQFSIRGIAPG